MTDEELHEKIFMIIYPGEGTYVDKAWKIVNLVKDEFYCGEGCTGNGCTICTWRTSD